MAKVLRSASPLALVSMETIGAMTNTRPFVVGLLGASGRSADFTAATVEEAEAYAVEQMEGDDTLFGAVVSCDGEPRPVSRVLPS